jgi:hypothetical protein
MSLVNCKRCGTGIVERYKDSHMCNDIRMQAYGHELAPYGPREAAADMQVVLKHLKDEQTLTQNAALEQAARVCEGGLVNARLDNPHLDQSHNLALLHAAEAIRALKT